MSDPQTLSSRFETWKERLLDLSLRNRLLHFNPERGTIPLSVADLGAFEDGLAEGIPLSPLPTTLPEEELWKRARALAREARLGLEEAGVSTLYCAVGSLQWFESETAETARWAPLLLYPIELTLDMARKKITLRPRGEDPIPNITLVEKMRRDFGLDFECLREPEEDEKGLDVKRLVGALREAIQLQKRWEIVETAHVGTFSFAKFLMWKDLDENGERFLENEVVRRIATQGAVVPAGDRPVPEVDTIPCVVDADATQLSAIAAALAGQSLVLQGPPGTGKSQTITNLIAAMIAAGKTVLFVSEKKAALEVVQRRLEAVGLADFCLELHSNKTNKKQVIDSLAQTLDRKAQTVDPQWAASTTRLREETGPLSSYVESLHAPHPLGQTAYEASARLRELTTTPELRLPLEAPEALTGERFAAQRKAVEEFAVPARAVEPVPEHPFHAAHCQAWSTTQEETLKETLTRVESAVAQAAPLEARWHSSLFDLELAPIAEKFEKKAGTLLGSLFLGGARRALEPHAKSGLEADVSIRDDLRQALPLTTAESTLRNTLAIRPNEGWRDHGPDLLETVSRFRNGLATFRPFCLYRAAGTELEALGLSPLPAAHEKGEVPSEALPGAFERSILSRWLATVRDATPALAKFDGALHHQRVARFRASDKARFPLARQEILRRLEQRLLSQKTASGSYVENSEQGILIRESRKKTKHLAIRKLFSKIPGLLPQLKPCLLMSPLSVAQYLPPETKRIDLVVFDEASQLATHDAIGAIARGTQVVIVGDSKQMPPTAFFQRNFDDDESPTDEVVELESILEEALAQQLPQQMLGWHYRSRHESLIEFSNRSFYDGKLHVFPAARRNDPLLGVELRPVPQGVYNERTNPIEAQALVAYLLERLQKFKPSERTFGVVTFSLPQQTLIEDLLDEARAKHPEIEGHFDGLDALFVKNLENVQGDERDEILFSICYAPDKEGKLRMNFGPLSVSGGERRLNVAITRAKCRLVIFSTLRPEQLDLARAASEGARLLKEFLQYAETQTRLSCGAIPILETTYPSAFEREIAEAIRGMGYEVRTAVGCGAYRIDLAVIDPKDPTRFLLGVECDGPSYRSGANARDRDRLRGEVLESLGWRLHRIWSTDWWFDAARETARLKAALEPPTP